MRGLRAREGQFCEAATGVRLGGRDGSRRGKRRRERLLACSSSRRRKGTSIWKVQEGSHHYTALPCSERLIIIITAFLIIIITPDALRALEFAQGVHRPLLKLLL